MSIAYPKKKSVIGNGEIATNRKWSIELVGWRRTVPAVFIEKRKKNKELEQ